MEEDTSKMHSEDDKSHLEKSKKRTVKTHAQVQALEKFYDDHKYPTESMKMQLAESIGLTEKQVSGWFCHRRLKDKRLMNGNNSVTGKQDQSSGFIQDHVSGHRQDSCGSTKEEDDRNFDTREVESAGLTLQECSAVGLTHEHGGHSGNHVHMCDASSGSISSLQNMSSDHNVNPFDITTSRYLIPKFSMDATGVKIRRGPSGYLKVKGQVENNPITAVKRQLGKHYREDGPPLGVEFESLPPGAFESSVQNPFDETYYTGEAILSVSPDNPKIHGHPKFGKGIEYSSSRVLHNSNVDRTSFRTPQVSARDAYATESRDGSARDAYATESRDGCRMRYKQNFQLVSTKSVSSSCIVQPFVNSRRELERSFRKYSDLCRNWSKGENLSSDLTMKTSEYDNSFDRVHPRQIAKDRKAYSERMVNGNRINIPYKNDLTAMKRMRDDFLHKSSRVDNQTGSYQIMRCAAAAEMPCSYTEDAGSAQTSCSME